MIMSAMSRPYVPWAPIRPIVGLAAAPVEVGRRTATSKLRSALGGPDSCRYANDNECDEPTICPLGTDTSIAGLAAAQVKWAATSKLRSAIQWSIDCRYANDNECDERSSVLWVPIHRIAVLAVGQLHRLHHQRQPRHNLQLHQ